MHIALLCYLFLFVVDCTLITKTEDPVEYQSTWAVQLQDGVHPSSLAIHGYEVIGRVEVKENTFLLQHTETHKRYQESHSLRFVSSPHITSHLLSLPDVTWAEQQYLNKHKTRAVLFSDPLFKEQWHLNYIGQFGAMGVDINVQGAWDMGFNGNGVRIAIVDDGYQTTHPDLALRYKADTSYSFNPPVGNSPDPDVTKDFHGTAVAGVALASNNSACGVGVAYMADASGIRLISEPTTDNDDATALIYSFSKNHIYSNSWGPTDDGVSAKGPGTITKEAIKLGTELGRGGLGSIYVWAGGNGRQKNDNCNYDGYVSMRQTIGVGAIGFNGVQSYYSEPCSALLICAPSSSLMYQAGIRTTDLVGIDGYDLTSSCTSTFGGTSAAAPLVSGVVALMLQARPSLTWRDVQNILAKTANITDPYDSDWVINGAGYHVNHKYGFGKVDATAAVKEAIDHVKLGDEVVASSDEVIVAKFIPDSPSAGIVVKTNISAFVSIENVIITMDIDHPASGDLQIEVISPSGTSSTLATPHADVAVLRIGEYSFEVGTATFGNPVDFRPLVGTLNETTPPDACSLETDCEPIRGNIAFVHRGVCTDIMKAYIVQNCGAIGMVVMNNVMAEGDKIVPMTGKDPNITVTSVSISYKVGQLITNQSEVWHSVATIQKAKYTINSFRGWEFSTVRCLGEHSNGTWTIKITDEYPADNGTFVSFKIDAYGTDPIAPNGTNDPVATGLGSRLSILGDLLLVVLIVSMLIL